MDNFFFWKSWNSEYRVLFYIAAGLLIAANLFLGFVYFSGIDFLQNWGSIQELATVPVNLHKFTDHYHEFQVKTINYLIYEKYTATNIAFPKAIVAVYVSILLIGITLYNTFLTTFSKYFYYIGTFLLMVFLATLNLDLLGIFEGSSKAILISFIIVLCGTSYAIYNFYYELTILKRFAIFLGLNILLFGGIYILSPLEANLINFHIAGYGSASLIVLCAMYILYVAIENVLFILFLNSANNRGGLIPYSALNLIYLGVLIMMMYFRMDVAGINIYTLIMLASICTIWGTLKRNQDNKLGDTVARVLMVIVLGAIVVSTLGFHYAHQNASFLAAVKKATLSSFLGYGALFFLFVMVNYIEQINYKQPVYPNVFRPAKLSVYHMFVMGSIATMGLFTQKYDKKIFYEAVSGYYNAVADFYYEKEEFEIAEPFYAQAKSNSPFNVKSNIALANISLEKGDLPAATEHFIYCTETGGSERAFLQLANIYNLKGDYFNALFTLKDGITYYPESSRLWNNLGLLSKKSNLADSTIHYFSKANAFAEKGDYTALNNLISYLIKHDFNEEAKELISSLEEEKYDLKTKAAIAAYNAKNGIFNTWKKQPFKEDTLLRTDELAYMFNHFINNIELMDTSDLNAIDKTSQSPHNMLEFEPLTMLKGFYEFYQGNPIVAKEHLATLGSGTSFYAGYYNNLLAYWMMMHHNYILANKYMAIADEYHFEQSRFDHAFIETILKNPAADTLWDGLKSKDSTNQIRYKRLIKNTNVATLTDFEKLLYLSFGHYDDYKEIIATCSDERVRNLVHFEYINHLLESGKSAEAEPIFNQHIEGLKTHIPGDALQLTQAYFFVSNGESDKALEVLNNNTPPFELESKALLIKAAALENRGNTENAAQVYQELVTRFPFFEQGLIRASAFMKKQGDSQKAYEIIVNGVKSLDYSLELKKMYVQLCLQQSLLDYAAQTMEELNLLMSPEEFRTFKAEYDKQLAEIEERYAEWK